MKRNKDSSIRIGRVLELYLTSGHYYQVPHWHFPGVTQMRLFYE